MHDKKDKKDKKKIKKARKKEMKEREAREADAVRAFEADRKKPETNRAMGMAAMEMAAMEMAAVERRGALGENESSKKRVVGMMTPAEYQTQREQVRQRSRRVV
eukprot:TRINITY_DN4303_c0_g1_i4.p2 TRINITY_DN4303_c0_g1~~TRINITY_DN4303_c0_g1_i4.p2  ORF type:complete len:104 (-),score=40.53 TRINITY_DN4303_c0_g1_i4:651-962(-)